MARLNNSLKFILMNVNIIFATIGLLLFALSLYLFFGNFGELDKELFIGIGLVLTFTGLSVMLASCLGCQGAVNQNEKFGHFWTGRKIIFIYEVLLLGSLGIELFFLSMSLRAAGEYDETYPLIDAGENPPYVFLEDVIEKKFNNIYFAARTTCTVTVYNQLWDWVGNHCPAGMDALNCQACFDYSATFCSADEAACYALSEGDGAACAYTQCRSGVLKYLATRIVPFSYAILSICCFQAVVAVINAMIMCFTPRDDLEKILIKSGTLQAAKQND